MKQRAVLMKLDLSMLHAVLANQYQGQKRLFAVPKSSELSEEENRRTPVVYARYKIHCLWI